MSSIQFEDQKKMEHRSKNLEKTKELKTYYYETKFFQILSWAKSSYSHDQDKNYYLENNFEIQFDGQKLPIKLLYKINNFFLKIA